MPRCCMVKKNGTKFPKGGQENFEKKTPGPKSPTEAAIAPTSPGYYRSMDVTITMANGYGNDYIPQNSQDNSVIRRTPVVTSHDGGIPIFRERSAEETEAAHDLLELSRSLPPLPNPVVIRVTPKYEDLSDGKFSNSYLQQERAEDSQIAYFDGSGSFKSSGPPEYPEANKSRIPVSVVVRVPPSVTQQGKGCVRGFSVYDNSSKGLPPLLSCDSLPSPAYLDESSPPVACEPHCSGRKAEISNESSFKSVPEGPSIVRGYEEPSALGYSDGLPPSATTDKNYAIAYEQGPNPVIIRMPPPQPQITHLVTRPVPKKVIPMPPDLSVPPQVVRFARAVQHNGQVPEERPQTSSVIGQAYPPPSGCLPSSQNVVTYGSQAEPAPTGTNVASYTPVIRFQAGSEGPTEYPRAVDRPEPVLKPPVSEYHSDAENNNPNSKSKSVTARKKRAKASFLPGEWKRKKASPSDETENPPKGGKYSCTQCGRKYATSSNLSRHKQTHRSLDSQSAKKCMTCGKAYVSMPALAMHLLTHKLSHACGVCGKMFSRPWLLQGHLRSHTGEKPYRCGHCGKAFADRSNLRAHMQTHSFEKNYICLKCKKSFALKSYLSKHLESSCLKENNEIEIGRSGGESPTNSVDTIDVETWSKDGDDVEDPIEIETDESMDEIVVV